MVVELVTQLEAIAPTTSGEIIGLFVNSLLAFLSLVVSDKIIEHRIEVYRLFIMSMASYFMVPLVFSLLGVAGISELTGLLSNYVIPLATWGILGVFMLKTNIKIKWSVAKTGFVVYSILTFIGLQNIVENFIMKILGS